RAARWVLDAKDERFQANRVEDDLLLTGTAADAVLVVVSDLEAPKHRQEDSVGQVRKLEVIAIARADPQAMKPTRLGRLGESLKPLGGRLFADPGAVAAPKPPPAKGDRGRLPPAVLEVEEDRTERLAEPPAQVPEQLAHPRDERPLLIAGDRRAFEG